MTAADLPAEPGAGRWLTCLRYAGRFLLLVDEFRADQVERYSLTIESTGPLEGGRRRYLARDAASALVIHPLGDYRVDQHSHSISLTQGLAQGRFLVAVTRDLQATARVLNGWAVEMRSTDRVFHLLHSNRSRRLRPLGPVQTDARYGLADWPALPTGAAVAPFSVQLHLFEATHVHWGAGHHLTLAAPGDLRFEVQQPPRDSTGNR